nr:MAG TPA: Flagellar and Swarming motility protein [Caudoviricetes sp.]
MFIKVTLLKINTPAYINIAHIEGFRPRGQHSNIWLSDRDIIEVDESPSEILKLIEEARNHGNQG